MIAAGCTARAEASWSRLRSLYHEDSHCPRGRLACGGGVRGRRGGSKKSVVCAGRGAEEGALARAVVERECEEVMGLMSFRTKGRTGRRGEVLGHEGTVEKMQIWGELETAVKGREQLA